MLSCRELVNHADRLLEDDLSFSARIAIKFHLLLCRHCRRYVKQLRRLVAAIPFMHNKATDEEVHKVMDCIHSHRNL